MIRTKKLIGKKTQESVAVGRSFAAKKDYQIDGNKETVALGAMNVIGSMTSCYICSHRFVLKICRELRGRMSNSSFQHHNVNGCPLNASLPHSSFQIHTQRHSCSHHHHQRGDSFGRRKRSRFFQKFSWAHKRPISRNEFTSLWTYKPTLKKTATYHRCLDTKSNLYCLQ